MPDHAKLAKIHIAKKELALSEDAYRDILWLNFKVRSAKELTDQQAQEADQPLQSQRLGAQGGRPTRAAEKRWPVYRDQARPCGPTAAQGAGPLA